MRFISFAVLFVALLAGCAGVSRFERGPLVAFGEVLEGAAEPRYYSIGIYTDRPVDSRVMQALVKLSAEASPVSIAELRPEVVAPYLEAFIPPPQWPESWKQKSREYEQYSGAGFHIKFMDGRLVSVGICSHCDKIRQSPVVGTPDGLKFYALPLGEPELAEVFGASEKIRKVREVTYGH